MAQGVAEAVMNLALSIAFTLWIRGQFGAEWGILGVAVGSVVPSLFFGWVVLWGWTAHEAQLSRWTLFRRCVLSHWIACAPMVAAAIALRLQPFWASGRTTLLMLAEGAVVGLVGAGGLWQFSLAPEDRQRLLEKVRRRTRRQPQPAVA